MGAGQERKLPIKAVVPFSCTVQAVQETPSPFPTRTPRPGHRSLCTLPAPSQQFASALPPSFPHPSTPSHTLPHLGPEGCSHGCSCMRRAECPAEIQRLLILGVQQRAQHPNRTSTSTSTRTSTRTTSAACRRHCLMVSAQQRFQWRSRTSTCTTGLICGFGCLGCSQSGACLIAAHC